MGIRPLISQSNKWNKWEFLGIGFILALSFWFRLPFVRSTTFGFRETQTAWPVKAWLFENDFDPLKPKVPIRGFPQEWLLEFPLFQWVSYFTALFLDISADTAVALVAVACWFSISVLTYLLIRNVTNKITALSALILMLFSPYGLRWGSTGLSDLISTTFGLFALLLLTQMHFSKKQESEIKSSVWMYATCLLALSAITKPNIALMYAIPILLMAIFSFNRPTLPKRILYATLSGFALLLSIFFWTEFASSQLSEYDARSIWSPNNETISWYFGSATQYRDSLSLNWEILYRTSLNLGGVALFLIAILGIFKTKNSIRKFSLQVSTGIFISWTIFINLNIVHLYYQIPAAPLLVMLISIGLSGWVDILCDTDKVTSTFTSHLPWIAVLTAIFTSYQLVGTARAETNLVRERNGPVELSREVAEHTSPNKGLIIGFGMTHDPTIFYQSNRRGFLLYDQWYPSEINYLYSQNLETFCYLVSANEELDAVALEVLAKFPGASRRSKHVYSLC